MAKDRPQPVRESVEQSQAGELPKNALAILFETIHDLTSTLAVNEVIRRLLRRVLFHLESEIASILVLDPDQKLRIKHAQGLPEEVVEETCLALGEGISGWVTRLGVPLLIENVEQDERFRRHNHERYYTSSAICVPLRVQGAVVGVINVNNKRNREPYSLEDLRLVEAIAGHAAVALSNAQRYEDTLRQAQGDSLTGLANHGFFWSTLGVEVERADRYERKLSLAMLDVDHFKAFNDRYGHVGGDEALAGVAEAIRQHSRVHDLPARYGGEEFAVILPETPTEGAGVFAERIRQAIEIDSFAGCSPGELTVSNGLATFPADASDPAELVRVADQRLYEAKEQGRNRISPASP